MTSKELVSAPFWSGWEATARQRVLYGKTRMIGLRFFTLIVGRKEMKIQNKTNSPLSASQEQQLLAQHVASLGVAGSSAMPLEELRALFPEEIVVVTPSDLRYLGRLCGFGF